MPRNKVIRFTQPIDFGKSFVLGVNKDIDCYKGEGLRKIVSLLSRTFSREQATAVITEVATDLPTSSREPARILLYADSLNAFNRMICHRMYPSNPISLEQAACEEEQEADSWFNGEEGSMLKSSVSWTHILRWRDIVHHESFAPALDRVKGLYLPREDRPSSLKQCNGDQTLIAQFSFSERIDSLVGKRVAANVKKIQEWNATRPDQQIVFNSGEAVRLNREYLFHECAGEFTIVAIAEESGRYFAPQYVLYPGVINEAILFVNQLIQDEYPERGKVVMHENRIKLPFSGCSIQEGHKASKATEGSSSGTTLLVNRVAMDHGSAAAASSGSASRQISSVGLFSLAAAEAALPPLQSVDIADAEKKLDDFWLEANGSYARFKTILLTARVIPLDRMDTAQQAELRAAVAFLERYRMMCTEQPDRCSLKV